MNEDKIYGKAREVMFENMVAGYSRSTDTHFHYTQPSPDQYPYQFFWDTCLHVFILTALGEHEMAKKHLVSLFALQEEDGFVGHMIYWNNVLPGRLTDIFQSKPSLKGRLLRTHMSALIQPPLVAQALLRIYEVSGDQEFLRQMLPKLKKYYAWLAHHRDFDGDGLITILSPFESGIDWKPSFDVVVGFPQKKADWRLFWKVVWVDVRNFFYNYNTDKIYRKGYFLVKEVGVNTIYAQNLLAMAKLCRVLNDPEAAAFEARADKVMQSMIRVMYDEETAAFYDVHGKENTQIKVLTPTVFFPVVNPRMPEEITQKVIDTHFSNGKTFDVPFPIPSVVKSHPAFNPKQSLYIWRGPTWILFNWWMHQFFLEKGHQQEAHKLIESIRQLIERSGFREYYHPFTGEGYGARDFTWAGLVVDMMNMEKVYDR